MEKQSKRKSSSGESQDSPSMIELINKVQQQLGAMEEKLDTLINQSQKKPFEKNYSQRPFRRPEHSNRHGRDRRGDGHRERTYTQVICADCNKECEIPFKPRGDSPVYCRECFPRHRKNNQFNANQDRAPKKRDFNKKPRTEKKDSNKKPRTAKKKTEKRKKPAKKKAATSTRKKKRT